MGVEHTRGGGVDPLGGMGGSLGMHLNTGHTFFASVVVVFNVGLSSWKASDCRGGDGGPRENKRG